MSATRIGSPCDDLLFGTPSDDILSGLGGDDRIFGQGGDDRLKGGSGDDVLWGDTALTPSFPPPSVRPPGDDLLAGGRGDDTLYGDGGDDTLHGGAGSDRLFGGGDDDRLSGGHGQDRLEGGSGDDRLFGGAGDDIVLGGSGDNLLHGGAGQDTVSWIDTPPTTVPGDAPGVILNLSDRLMFWGYQDGHIAVDFLVFPDSAVRVTEHGLEVDQVDGFERFEGSRLENDIAVLPSGFEEVAKSNDGYTAYSDGSTTISLREFEFVLLS